MPPQWRRRRRRLFRDERGQPRCVPRDEVGILAPDAAPCRLFLRFEYLGAMVVRLIFRVSDDCTQVGEAFNRGAHIAHLRAWPDSLGSLAEVGLVKLDGRVGEEIHRRRFGSPFAEEEARGPGDAAKVP